MYEEASIQKLSQPQIKKLLKGLPVRVKHGSGMSVMMSKAQHKKLMSAHKKGAGTILQLDPYLQQRGQGVITDVIKEIGMELLPHAIDAVANVAKKRVSKHGKGIVSEVVKEIGMELLPHAIDAVANVAKKRVSKHGKGKSGASEFFGKIGNAFKSRFNDQGSPQERQATSVILNKIEPALIRPLQLLAPPVGQVAEAQRDILKTHYGLGSRPKLVKGSPEAKAYMASIRAKKNGGALMTAGMGNCGGALAPAGAYYY